MKIYLIIAISVIVSSCSTSKNFKWTVAYENKASEIGLEKNEVLILASIVEQEATENVDKPIVARVFLNRLDKSMPLQSDATIRYAIGNPLIERLKNEHFKIDSPFNTYQNNGLPPEPICKPSTKTILAVLYSAENNYLYFCPKPDLSGQMNYATTLVEHIKNAKLYSNAISESTSSNKN